MSLWREYGELYEELSQWFKECDARMKERSGPQATLEDKTTQLEQQKVRSVPTVPEVNWKIKLHSKDGMSSKSAFPELWFHVHT